jgi:pimeloyl-ACP methyl ester carboxylesterase
MIQERMIRSFDGTPIYVRTQGQGPVLIFCDGLGCDGYIWKYLARALEKNHQLVFWHYRGHGRSGAPKHPHALGLSALRSDLTAVMDALGVARANMLGHSMGVQLLLDLALSEPERIHAMVLLCGGPGRPLDTLHGTATLGRAFPLMRNLALRFPGATQAMWQAVLKSELCFQWAKKFEVNGALVQRADIQPYFDHLCAMDVRFFVNMVTHLQAHTVVNRLDRVRNPALIVAGEHDTLTPLRLSEIMRERMPCAQMMVVPQGSHVAPIEQPGLVNEGVLRFLAQQGC